MNLRNRLAAVFLIAGMTAVPAVAQTGPDHVLTPAPVPSVSPGSSDAPTGTGTIPDRIAPTTGDAGTPSSLSAGPTNATPFSGVPSSLNSGTNQASPGGSQLGRDTLTPNLSK